MHSYCCPWFSCVIHVSCINNDLSSFALLSSESMEDGVKALSKLRAGEPISTLPWYSLSDIQNHKDLKSSIWVVFRQGVYDITEFVQMHPGGEIIMKAAGGSIEPFWAMYGVHLQDEVFELLESYRIGTYWCTRLFCLL